MRCPACGFEQPEGRSDCRMCGAIFARFAPSRPLVLPFLPAEDPLAPRAVSSEAWINIAVGFGLALLSLAVPFLRVIFTGFAVLVHEMGHAVAGWLFGHLSVPAFDLKYGGGVTLIREQSPAILACLYAAAVCGLYRLRRNRCAWIVFLPLLALYALLAHTRWNDALILLMGHGFELVIGGLFLYRGLSGRALVNPAERPLYSLIGWFLVLHNMFFSGGLVFSVADRVAYGLAKGGGHWMDFERIGRDYLGLSLSTVSFLFLLLCFLPPVVAWLAHRYQPRLYLWIDLLTETE